jgi:hypothetical protein
MALSLLSGGIDRRTVFFLSRPDQYRGDGAIRPSTWSTSSILVGDGRTLFTIGAFFRVPIGEPIRTLHEIS